MPAFAPPPRPIEYLFVDGSSLTNYLADIFKKFCEHEPKKYCEHEPFDLDFTNIRNISYFDKVFYYDAIAPDEVQYAQKRARQLKLFERLKSTDCVHLYEGDARQRSSNKRALQQKMVDVMLAVDMLTHSFRRNMQRAWLFTGDQDFKPLVDALVAEGMFVTLWYPPGKTNSELIAAADQRRPMGLENLSLLLTPESRKRFPPLSVAILHSDSKPGGKRLEWNGEDGRNYGIYREGCDWVFTACSGDESNWLHIRSAHCVRTPCLERQTP